MAGELFKAMSGTDIVHVPHKASGEARNSVIGGHVQMMFDAITTMAPNVQGRAGARARHLRPPSARRCCPTCRPSPRPACPATNRPSGSASWRRPARRKAIVDKLNAEINKAITAPDVKEAWAKQGAVPLVMSPAEFDKYLRADIEKWAHVVQVSGHQGGLASGLRVMPALSGHHRTSTPRARMSGQRHAGDKPGCLCSRPSAALRLSRCNGLPLDVRSCAANGRKYRAIGH